MDKHIFERLLIESVNQVSQTMDKAFQYNYTACMFVDKNKKIKLMPLNEIEVLKDV